MRALFTFFALGGLGHFLPLVPFAAALRDAGHTVAFAAPASYAAQIEAAGFDAVTAGASLTDPELAPLRSEQLAFSGPARSHFTRTRLMAGALAERMAADLLALAPRWMPDLFVRDAAECGACLAAESLGLPHAMVIVHVARGDGHYQDDIVVPLNARRTALGLAPDPHLAMLSRYLVLDPTPPGYRDADYPTPRTLHAIRPSLPEVAAFGAPPDWLATLPPRPTVYVGMGTDPGTPQRAGLVAAIVVGLRDEPLNVVATVGAEADPAAFEPQPPNIRVERFLPLAHVLPRCDLVVCHGGSGTVMAALAHGLPLVIVPMAADQPHNAARCEALGVGRTLLPADCTPEAVRSHVRALLADATYRANAARLRDATAALPGMDHAAALLARLAAEKRPILADATV